MTAGKKGEKQLSLPQLKVRNEAKKERKMNKLGKKGKTEPPDEELKWVMAVTDG